MAMNSNNVEAIEFDYKLISTGYNKQTKLSSVLSSENSWVNPCNPKFIKLLRLARPIEHVYSGESVTYISAKYYGITALWYLVIACSGYLHQDEIPKGTSIFLPSSADIVTAISEPVESNVGKTIII